MQAYFDRDDADVEQQRILANGWSHTDPDAESCADALGRNKYLNLLALSAGVATLALIVVFHLGSAEPLQSQSIPDPNIPEIRFIVETAKPEPPKPRPKPKAEVLQEKPQPQDRLRSIPDKLTRQIRPQGEQHLREEKVEIERNDVGETVADRSLPAIKTPQVAVSERTTARHDVQEGNRQASVPGREISRQSGIPTGSTGEHRAIPDSGPSHIKLDPYHYQMVTICLRLCVRTIFTHAGMNDEEREKSRDWLRVKREGEDFFEFRFAGYWIRFQVNVNSLADISNISFVSVPASWSAAQDGQALLESATRSLCRLLGYDDCLKKF